MVKNPSATTLSRVAAVAVVSLGLLACSDDESGDDFEKQKEDGKEVLVFLNQFLAGTDVLVILKK